MATLRRAQCTACSSGSVLPRRTGSAARSRSPTDAQIGAWDAISHGRHALVVAPTGSGKTLSAFLWAIDRVFHEKPLEAGGHARPEAIDGCRSLPHPHPLHLAAEGTGRRRRAQPPVAARRDRAVRAAARDRAARGHGRRPIRRHDLERSAQARHGAARHPHHDTRVALPDAHEPGGRDAQERAHRDRRRGARRRRDQARRPPRGEPRTPRRDPRQARAAHRAVGDGAADRRGRSVPRRLRAGRDRRAAGDEGLRHARDRAGRRHAQPAAAARQRTRARRARRSPPKTRTGSPTARPARGPARGAPSRPR